MNRLFWKKILLAFVLGAVPAVLSGVIVLLENDNADIFDARALGVAILAVVMGAVSAGLRAVLALFTDWMPTDRLHGPGDSPTAVTVSRDD